MSGFHELIKAYIAANPNWLPPADEEGCLTCERDDLDWKVSVRNGGEIFSTTISCEDLLGWLWRQQCGPLIEKEV